MSRRIIVFAREPIPGRVKTRLARDIGAESAASIYARLLEHTLDEALGAGIPVLLSLAEALEGEWSPRERLEIQVQQGADLGERMWNTFRRSFAEGVTEALLIGSDCPGLSRIHLLEAFEQLRDVPVVLGPAEDGGYWAIGQRSLGVDCFSGVPWSTPETLEATRASLRCQGVPWSELETLGDVDTSADLHLLKEL